MNRSSSNSESLDGTYVLDASTSKSSPGVAVGLEDSSGNHISIPADASQGVAFGGASGVMRVKIPEAREVGQGVQISDGAVAYPSDTGSATTVVPLRGGVQLLASIANKNSPTEYTYEFDLQGGQYIEVTNSGAAVYDASGEIESLIAKPWAVDAEGSEIPTRYDVRGNSLVQVVDHTSVSDIKYPVVADPIILAPWVVRCLMGIGLNSVQITRIAQTGTPAAIVAAGGYAALRCVMGR